MRAGRPRRNSPPPDHRRPHNRPKTCPPRQPHRFPLRSATGPPGRYPGHRGSCREGRTQCRSRRRLPVHKRRRAPARPETRPLSVGGRGRESYGCPIGCRRALRHPLASLAAWGRPAAPNFRCRRCSRTPRSQSRPRRGRPAIPSGQAGVPRSENLALARS